MAAPVIMHKLRRLCAKGLRVCGGVAADAADLSLCRRLLHHCCFATALWWGLNQKSYWCLANAGLGE